MDSVSIVLASSSVQARFGDMVMVGPKTCDMVKRPFCVLGQRPGNNTS